MVRVMSEGACSYRAVDVRIWQSEHSGAVKQLQVPRSGASVDLESGCHLSHTRLSTARMPIATHRRMISMLASATPLVDRAGRVHSSEFGMSRTGTTLAACHASMLSIRCADASPWQVSRPLTMRQVSI